MNPSVYYISLDMHTATSQAEIHAIELDSNRKIVATLYENGKPYTITEDCSAILRAEKPDGTVLFNSCTISGNKISYIFTNQTTAAVGIVKCEITLYGGDSKQITSPKFVLVVEKTLYSDSEVESQDEFTALESAIAVTNNLNVSASKSGNVATITVTKKDGTTQTATISDGAKGDKGDPGDPAVIDRTYDPTSENAQSGTAVAEAVATVEEAVDSKQVAFCAVTKVNDNWYRLSLLPNSTSIGFTGDFEVEMDSTPKAQALVNVAHVSNAITAAVSPKEDKSNKVTSLSPASTNTQYPSAKCVYDLVGNINTILASVITPSQNS